MASPASLSDVVPSWDELQCRHIWSPEARRSTLSVRDALSTGFRWEAVLRSFRDNWTHYRTDQEELRGLAERLDRAGARIYPCPPEDALRTRPLDVQFHIRENDLLLPVCPSGLARSQVLHVVLQDIARDINREVATVEGPRRFARVGLPHGSHGGFEPPPMNPESYDRAGLPEFHHIPFEKEVAAGTPGAGQSKVDECFLEVFGRNRMPRVGSAYCDMHQLRMLPVDATGLDENRRTRQIRQQLMQWNRMTSFIVSNYYQRKVLARELDEAADVAGEPPGTELPPYRIVYITFAESTARVMDMLLASRPKVKKETLQGVHLITLPLEDPLDESAPKKVICEKLRSMYATYAKIFRPAKL